jgi:hypothetical protein
MRPIRGMRSAGCPPIGNSRTGRLGQTRRQPHLAPRDLRSRTERSSMSRRKASSSTLVTIIALAVAGVLAASGLAAKSRSSSSRLSTSPFRRLLSRARRAARASPTQRRTSSPVADTAPQASPSSFTRRRRSRSRVSFRMRTAASRSRTSRPRAPVTVKSMRTSSCGTSRRSSLR